MNTQYTSHHVYMNIVVLFEFYHCYRLNIDPTLSRRIQIWSLSIPGCLLSGYISSLKLVFHDDVIKWKYFPRYWPFVREIHRGPVNSSHKDQWRGALMFSLICAWMNRWVNNREAGDLRRYRHCNVLPRRCSVTVNYSQKCRPHVLESPSLLLTSRQWNKSWMHKQALDEFFDNKLW